MLFESGQLRVPCPRREGTALSHSYPAHFKRRSWRPPPISFQDKTLYNTTWSEEQGVERDRAGRELKKGEEGCNEIEEGLREERIEAVEEGDEG
ncbi:hypothetical protein Pmani_038975 [Petrolisthes manimaculis]|uniref:Uncharacterized protein n=1 Tax=Petrolisthes manimaculis TaxID=1843537 RepID=A0AAE1NEK4_9EUCA|nr:hypothetical protein Pmani_038975 [Petrolisthes manimaculis]